MLTRKRFHAAMQSLFPQFEKEPPPGLVACSGGVDSMALLDLLRHYYAARGAKGKLSVCYVDHAQRPRAETAKDEEVILSYCRRHGLPLVIRRLELPPGAPEDVLREARYSSLKKVAVDRVVFTGHHAQDNVETYLFRLIRGAHPETFKGIAARSRRRGGLRLARPLLGFWKSDIIDYATRRNLVWHEDSTNTSPAFARNRLRHELLPLLESFRPGAVGRIFQFFNDLENAPARCPKPAARRVEAIKRQLLSEHGHPVLKAQFHELKAALDDILDEHARRTTRAQWDNLKRQLSARHMTRLGGGPQKIVQFPGGHALHFRGNRLFLVLPTN
jgi:tRNA(Ile)-lysidine synthase